MLPVERIDERSRSIDACCQATQLATCHDYSPFEEHARTNADYSEKINNVQLGIQVSFNKDSKVKSVSATL